ncbi:AMP-binding protein [Mycobacterium sp. shizuoka-1]|uniref:AMP-binding protein n=1 Tax=Mycobacterium sp. shizuoka-1 TaxID=2039281 RepID=UPI00352A970A
MRATIEGTAHTVRAIQAILRAGTFEFPRVDRSVRMARLVRQAGPFAGLVRAHANNGLDRPAIIDHYGTVTYAELDRQTNALARAWRLDGLGLGDSIGVICRNHRGLVIAVVAAGKIGARVVLMNTGSAAPEVAGIAAREHVHGLVYDADLAANAADVAADVRRYVSWGCGPDRSLDELIATNKGDVVPLPSRFGGATLLTSGTTGIPKGAPREKLSPLAAAQLLDRIPLRAEQTILIPIPLFHATGFALLIGSLALRMTMVLQCRFEPADALRLLAEHQCDAAVVVPTVLQRMVNLGPEVLRRYDTSNLKIVLSAGAALAPDLCRSTADAFGDVLYNGYGSTEVAIATVATPAELRLVPGTAGRPPATCRIALFDNEGRRITEPGVIGRIFAANGAGFDGYTDGRDKQRIDGMISTGDMGHIDEHGLLWVEGRDDDMIISGGENVYPIEIENLLADRPDVIEACVIGVPDPDFGQRLRAFVVPTPDSARDADAIKEYVRKRLARHKIPRDLVFVDELPRNATGKVLRRALATQDADG